VFYYNKERQAAHEKRTREAFAVDMNLNFIDTTDYSALNKTAKILQ